MEKECIEDKISTKELNDLQIKSLETEQENGKSDDDIKKIKKLRKKILEKREKKEKKREKRQKENLKKYKKDTEKLKED